MPPVVKPLSTERLFGLPLHSPVNQGFYLGSSRLGITAKQQLCWITSAISPQEGLGLAHDLTHLTRVTDRLEIAGDDLVERRSFWAGDLDDAASRPASATSATMAAFGAMGWNRSGESLTMFPRPGRSGCRATVALAFPPRLSPLRDRTRTKPRTRPRLATVSLR